MIEKIVKPFITPIQRKILAPMKKAKNWPKLLAKWIKAKIKSVLGQKEITKASYVPVGNYYISKKLIVIVLLIILVLYFFIFIKPPKFVNKWLNRKPAVTAAASGTAGAYTGAARVYDADGKLLYEGELLDGVYNGPGKLFAPDGSLQAEGQFANGSLAQGSVYDGDGALLYSGALADGMYSGQGTSYYPNGAVKYQGEFKAGVPSGQGRLFGEDGALLYEGAFANGVYQGEGVEYGEGGAIVYQGSFLAGKYNGTGKLLTPEGFVRYEGGFVNGMPSGQGVMYDEEGNKWYEGSFVSGEFSGQGTLYSADGLPQYAGGFLAGKYHGQGELYGPLGTVEYKGNFVNGALSGAGIWLRPDGSVVFQGVFSENEPDPSAYLGLSAARLEETLGGPPTTVDIESAGVQTDPFADDLPFGESPDPFAEAEGQEDANLIMSYHDLRIVFVLSTGADGFSGVTEVRIATGELLDRIHAVLEAEAAADPSVGPHQDEDDRSLVFRRGGAEYTIRLNADGAPVSAVIVRG